MSLDNQTQIITPLTLDGLTSIELDSLNLAGQEGVLQALNDGSVYSSYSVKLDELNPASIGNTIDINSNLLIQNQLAINGATLGTTYGANINGNINISGNYFINGAPLAFSGSNWTPYGTGIYRNSNVGIGQFVTGNLIYDLQLGQIGTTLPRDKTISIPVAFDRNARVRLSECGPSATETEAGFDIQLNGANNRLEILSGSNATPAGQAFSTRSISIDRTTGYVSIGSSMDFTQPLYVYGGATVSRQARFQGGSNASIQVQGFSGSLEMCVSNATGNFSINSNRYDSVIRSMTGTRLMFQSGDGRAALLIDALNNVSVGVPSNLTNAMTISGSLAITNNNIFVLGATNGVQVGNSNISTLNGIFNDSLGGVAIYANNNTAIRSNTNGELSMGATIPVAGVRLTTDGSVRVNGNLDIRGGNQLQFNGVQASTTNIPEGSNQYFTNTRARQAISVSSSSSISLTYNNALGVISADIATTAGFSNWSAFGTTGIFRNSRVGINATLCGTASALYIRTSAGIGGGIQIDSDSTGSLSIRQKTLNNHEIIQAMSESNGYSATRTAGGNSQFIQIDQDGNFNLNNSVSASGTNLRLTNGLQTSITQGYQINLGGADAFHVNQNTTGTIQFWVGGLEDWRITASGGLNNVQSNDSNALRVSGNIFFNNGETRINNLILTGNSIISSSSTSLSLFVTGSSGLIIDSLNNISCSGFNFAPLKRQQIFSLTSLNGGLSYLSASFYKVYTTSNIHLEINTNCYSTVASQPMQLIPYLHSATGAYMNRLACTQYYFSINPASVHFHPSFTRLCLNLTGGQFYTIRFLYSGSGITTATSNQLFGIATEVPL